MADYWMKLYIEILDDPKMATLPDRIWRRIIELFLCGKRIGKGGHLPSTQQLAWMLRMSADELEKDLAQISPTGIVVPDGKGGWFIPKFQERQEAVPDRERKAQERARKQSQQYYEEVTEQSRNVTQSTESEDRVQKTETEAEAEQSKPDPYFSSNPLSVAFEQESHIAAPGTDPRKWIEACNKMTGLGIVPGDVKQATYQLIQKGYTVIGPSSVVNAAINVMTKRTQDPNDNGKPNGKASNYPDIRGAIEEAKRRLDAEQQQSNS